MAAKPTNPLEATLPSSPAMPTTSLQPTTLDAALKTHSNDTATIPSSPPVETARSPMTPADLRTLKKILNDTQSPSPPISPVIRQQDDSLLNITTSVARSSDTGIEDEVQYVEKQFNYGDEREEGYEDEDDSMELSDEGLEDYEAEGSVLLVDEEREYVWSDGDTIEDIMNTPGQTASPARPQHIDGVYQHDPPTPGDIKEIKLQHAAIEQVVKQERLDQENREAAAIGDETAGLDQASIREQDDAVELSGDSDFQTVQTARAQTGLSRIEEDEEPEVEFEYFEPINRRTSRRFSPAPISRRASEDSLPAPSFHDMAESRPAVVATPSGHHLAFTPNSAIPATPFTKTLNYFKQFKGKENSPTKSRRNASLPEEIAELAREAKEEEDLEIYREMDLAPMEPVMESTTAGDLITLGTPVRTNIMTPPLGLPSPVRLAHRPTPVSDLNDVRGVNGPPAAPVVIMETSSDHALAEATRMKPSGTSPSTAPLPVEQGGIDDADVGTADTASGTEDKQLLVHEPPTFVTVVGMLPRALFWTAAAPVAKYSYMAYEALVEKFAGLGVRDES